ncbi:hypothetical protein FRB93_007968 [Tulasnella sp. JGI-2019a]|nr:hypothetical protein FRB93_007968 [Tulasnella sp. JGI-2019a]
MADQATTNRTLTHYEELSFGVRLGDFMILETAICSFLAVAIFLTFALWNAWKAVDDQSRRRHKWIFLSSASDYYLLALLFFDLILCTGQILDARWVHLGHIVTGPYCLTQGTFQQTGDVGVALANLAIACHTFAVLFFRWKPPTSRWLPLSVILVICLILFLATLIPGLKLKGTNWGIATDWCWISPHYTWLQLGLEYFIFWAVALILFILYIPLFFCLRGNIYVDLGTEDWGRGKMRIS